LLSIAAVYDGMNRTDAARIGGMDRQTLRDWAHRFNEDGPTGLVNRKAPGALARLTAGQLVELAALVETGPDPVGDVVVRWRCLDLKAWIKAQFGVVYCERSVSRLLHELGFSHVSARPRHAGQVPEVLEDFKKLPAYTGGGHRPLATRYAD
jgi:transposase